MNTLVLSMLVAASMPQWTWTLYKGDTHPTYYCSVEGHTYIVEKNSGTRWKLSYAYKDVVRGQKTIGNEVFTEHIRDVQSIAQAKYLVKRVDYNRVGRVVRDIHRNMALPRPNLDAHLRLMKDLKAMFGATTGAATEDDAIDAVGRTVDIWAK